MKILLVHQYYNTPETGGPLRSYYLAKGLVHHGYEVEVITSCNGSAKQTNHSGFKVHYLPISYDNHMGFASRVSAFARFAWLAYKKALTIKGISICYAISTPLSVGWVAKKLKAARNIPYIFEVGDLWPEAPVQMGVLKQQWVINAMRRFEQSVYAGASGVVALSPGIKKGVLNSEANCKVTVVPNMADCQFFQIETKNPQWEKQFGVAGKTVVTYFGAAGRANHLEYLVEAARAARSRKSQLHFLVVAYGSELEKIKTLAKAYRLDNLSFQDYCNRSQLREIINVTDVVYVSYANVPVLTTGSPNKFFDGLAAGKLVVVNFKGWLKQMVERHQLGFYVDPETPESLTEVLTPLVDDPAKLLEFQQNSRLIAETFFSRNLAVQKLVKFMDKESYAPIKESEVYTLTA